MNDVELLEALTDTTGIRPGHWTHHQRFGRWQAYKLDVSVNVRLSGGRVRIELAGPGGGDVVTTTAPATPGGVHSAFTRASNAYAALQG